ncbi:MULTISPECIES: SDR family oxidoreductase [Luteimonas]|uniref:SDR family oxidoreductase n=1 Tax=Luteimonas TaxID=83614 RepID=UPI000C7A2384|nr:MULTISPECIES: SDR family NAD(P)-dependent oxidoreductase [Luteimonas]
MRMSGHTILITGGTSGIGRELARQLAEYDNTVIVTGRDPARLDAARAAGLHALHVDIDDPAAVQALHQRVIRTFPDLDLLINSAGILRTIDLQQGAPSLPELTREVQTNLNGTIWMNALFLPQLLRHRQAAIVNVSSALAFLPLPTCPVYCATKAAIHSYTQSLRLQLRGTGVQVFELAPPATDTPLHRGLRAGTTRDASPMSVAVLATHAIEGMQGDRLEIRPGSASTLRFLSRLAPDLALHLMGRSMRRQQAQRRLEAMG